jgi:hypothetical protein
VPEEVDVNHGESLTAVQGHPPPIVTLNDDEPAVAGAEYWEELKVISQLPAIAVWSDAPALGDPPPETKA